MRKPQSFSSLPSLYNYLPPPPPSKDEGTNGLTPQPTPYFLPLSHATKKGERQGLREKALSSSSVFVCSCCCQYKQLCTSATRIENRLSPIFFLFSLNSSLSYVAGKKRRRWTSGVCASFSSPPQLLLSSSVLVPNHVCHQRRPPPRLPLWSILSLSSLKEAAGKRRRERSL